MTYSKIFLTLAATAAITLAGASAALADKKPKGAKKTEPQVIAQLYAGKTSNWNSGGHAYWGANGQYKAINKKGTAVGVGKWFVTTRGRLCNETTWYWPEDGQTKSEPYEECWEFVTAPDGTIWERYMPDKTEWYRHKTEKQVNGEAEKAKFNRIASNLGL
jgi:phage/plasmid-associated DNA primase